jgi:hypothetical protein
MSSFITAMFPIFISSRLEIQYVARGLPAKVSNILKEVVASFFAVESSEEKFK